MSSLDFAILETAPFHDLRASVIVDDLHVVAMARAPDKADPPLIVNADPVLTLTITAEFLQLIARRRRQNSQLGRGVQLKQFTQCNTLESTEALAMAILKQLLRLLRAKTLDHT